MQDSDSEIKLAHLTKPKPHIGKRLFSIIAFTVFIFILLVMIALAGRIGAQAGTNEYRIRATATGSALLVDWFLRGIDQMQQGNYPLAEANFLAILKAQPSNTGVQQLVATVRSAQTPTVIPPTITPVPTDAITDKILLFTALQNASDAKDYDQVISLSDQLKAIDAEYENGAVADLRFQALVARGKSRLSDGDIEAGLYDLDIASSIRELDASVQQQRQIAAMYQNAINYIGADWEKAIALLSQVYAITPRYRDIGSRLLDAFERSGDSYASVQQWCPAEARYASAMTMSSLARITQKRNDAHQKCVTATPEVITPANGTVVPSQSLPGLTGSIIFAAVDPASGAYHLQALNTTKSQLTTLEVGGSQPAYQRNAGIVAYAFGSAIHGLAANNSVVVLGSFSGAWPSVSPDGTRIAFAEFQNGTWSIYINRLQTSAAPVKLIQGSHPVWGPSGRIAFQGCMNGMCGIYVVNPDQPSELQRITTTAGDISMQWSPDGTHLVYMTNFTGNWEIYTVALANLQFRQITSGSGISAIPAWSPDGSYIAFESNREGNWGLYVVGSEGGDAHKILTIGSNHPAWQSERLAWIP